MTTITTDTAEALVIEDREAWVRFTRHAGGISVDSLLEITLDQDAARRVGEWIGEGAG